MMDYCCTLIDVYIEKLRFSLRKGLFILYITHHIFMRLCSTFYFFYPNNLSFEHLDIWHMNIFDVLVSICKGRKCKLLQLSYYEKVILRDLELSKVLFIDFLVIK